MPHKDPEIRRAYMRVYHRKHLEHRKAQKKKAKKAMFERDPEGTREKWRRYRKAARARAALRELERIKASRPPKADKGYVGKLCPNGL